MTHRLALSLCTIFLAVMSVAAQRRPVETGEISGVVMRTGDSPILLARVLVTISGDALKPSRTVITDDAGRFAFKDLPAGRFTLVAARPPYIRTAFGARRPGRPGTPITLAGGERLAGVTISMARGAAITGVVRNAGGDVAVGTQVVATPLDATTDPGVPVVTDDRGVYRVFGLPPGRYIVTATIAGLRTAGFTQLSDAEMDRILGNLQRRMSGAGNRRSAPGSRPAEGTRTSTTPSTFANAPSYYPGTADPEQAQILTLAEGDERAGVDFDLQLVRPSTIEGRVSIGGGAVPPNTQVTLTRPATRLGQSNPLAATMTARLDPSGGFRFTNVLPGTYRVIARATTTGPVTSAQPGTVRLTGVLWGLADVTVAGEDLAGVALTLQPGLKVTGRSVFDARTLTPPDNVQLRLTEIRGNSPLARAGGGRSNGPFEISGLLPGTYTFSTPLADAGWWLRSVVIDGRDALDFPLELGAAGDVGGAIATFTDRRTELSGTLQSAANVPAPDYFLVVLSADPTHWRAASRRVQFTRPGTDGRFIVRDLPAGDYLMAAVPDLDSSDLGDVTFMERLVSAAIKVTLGEGEKKTQDLTLAK
jgi:hypothetical protein